MKEQKVLVKFDADWADEFNCYGFSIMPETVWKKYKEDLKKLEWPQERYFGTNESFNWETRDEHLKDFKVKKISEKESEGLAKLFGLKPNSKESYLREYGQFCTIDVEEILADQAFDNEEITEED